MPQSSHNPLQSVLAADILEFLKAAGAQRICKLGKTYQLTCPCLRVCDRNDH